MNCPDYINVLRSPLNKPTKWWVQLLLLILVILLGTTQCKLFVTKSCIYLPLAALTLMNENTRYFIYYRCDDTLCYRNTLKPNDNRRGHYYE